MKNCFFNIRPRQSGKTTKLLSEFTDCVFKGFNSYFVTVNSNMKEIVKRKLWEKDAPKLENRILSSNNLLISDISSSVDFLFIDEYLFFDKTSQTILNNISEKINYDIIIKTTANKLIDRDLFNLVRISRKEEFAVSKLSKIIENEYWNEFVDLYNNLITHPKTLFNIAFEERKRIIGEETFETEYLGKLFKE